MRSNGFTRNDAVEDIGGATHGLRSVPAPIYDQHLGRPHPTLYRCVDTGRYAFGHRRADNQSVDASAWHSTADMPRKAVRRLAAKCDRRQRRGRVAKKIAARGGRRRFGTPAWVRRANAGR